MSQHSFNYMDGVPVKIAENFKPPPRVYQLPQPIANRVALPKNHYEESPQYQYDFQLERSVIKKMSEWRRMRQLEREARQERLETREQQRLQELEAKQKQLLGAVSYPSAEDLSSTDSDEVEDVKQVEVQTNYVTQHTGNFNNILQPTILSRNEINMVGGIMGVSDTITHAGNVFNVGQLSNAFNYKDFEDDTSSPFDNIELKTINDLDILAQVLHNTHLKAKELQKNKEDFKEQQQETKECNSNTQQITDNLVNSNDSETCCYTEGNSISNTNTTKNDINTPIQNAMAADLNVIENTTAALKNVDFSNISQQLQEQNTNIPNAEFITKRITQQPEISARQAHGNNFVYQQQQQDQHTNYATYAPNTQLNYMSYNGLEQQQQQQQQQYGNAHFQASAAFNNQNYLYASNCNGDTAYFSPTHSTNYIGHNANNYLGGNYIANSNVTFNSKQFSSYQQKQTTQKQQSPEMEKNSKSKSVPDILKELSDEVRDSKMRRSANNSHCIEENSKFNAASTHSPTTRKATTITAKQNESHYYGKLEATTQKLAKNISSMGFPIERVSKIAQMYGADDKKIIEHLISLSELMDLGFDEAKISDALLKFDNNKEKALEYLIS